MELLCGALSFACGHKQHASNLRYLALLRLPEIIRTKTLRIKICGIKACHTSRHHPTKHLPIQHLRSSAPFSAAICVNPFLLPTYQPLPLPRQIPLPYPNYPPPKFFPHQSLLPDPTQHRSTKHRSKKHRKISLAPTTGK